MRVAQVSASFLATIASSHEAIYSYQQTRPTARRSRRAASGFAHAASHGAGAAREVAGLLRSRSGTPRNGRDFVDDNITRYDRRRAMLLTLMTNSCRRRHLYRALHLRKHTGCTPYCSGSAAAAIGRHAGRQEVSRFRRP